jgi:hypothetical protein
MPTFPKIIEQTKKWIVTMVGCHFYPFAAQVIKEYKIHYEVVTDTAMASFWVL